MSTELLIVGHVLAVPLTIFVPGFLRLWRRREPLLFAAEEVGAVAITVGWALRGNTTATAFNALWLAGFTTAYAVEGRKRSRAAVSSARP